MQFQVPQFIETEDKIIGGVLTLKQFLIIAAAGGVSFIFYFLFAIFTWLLMTTLIGVIAFGLAFIKIQGRSVPTMIVAALRYYWNPRFYLWRSEATEPETAAPALKAIAGKGEAPKQFSFHRKEVQQAILSPEPAHKEVEPRPASWSETKPVPPPVPEIKKERSSKISEVADQLKQAELLEREVIKLENAKAKLESDARKLAAEKSATMPKTAAVEEVSPKAKESFSAPAQETIEEKIIPKYYPQKTIDAGPETPKDTAETLLGLRQNLATAGGRVQSLYQKLSTSKTSLPKRERKLVDLGNSKKERLELLRKATGEIEMARRVDYSDSRHL